MGPEKGHARTGIWGGSETATGGAQHNKCVQFRALSSITRRERQGVGGVGGGAGGGGGGGPES